jgi:hypothetical protein
MVKVGSRFCARRAQPAQDLLGADGQLDDGHAGGVAHGVGDGGRYRDERLLLGASRG